MAAGTRSGLLDRSHSQSVFKHAILRRHILPFVEMTGSSSPGRNVAVVDGFAGKGRYPDGQLASAGLMLEAAVTAPNAKIHVHLVEKHRADYEHLAAFAAGYRDRGVLDTCEHGDIDQHLDAILERSTGMPLFLFLDPCGAGLSFERLRGVLTGPRRAARPQTDVLLNFSADLTRRAAGALLKAQDDHDILPVMDRVCGDVWWRELAYGTSTINGFETLANHVADQYAIELGKATGMHAVAVPVRRAAHHQPVYHLVFLTRSPFGLWVFAEATAKARHDWMLSLGPDPDDNAAADGALFGFEESVDVTIEGERVAGVGLIEGNLRRLVAGRNGRIRLGDSVMEVFGAGFGEVEERTVAQAVRNLAKSGEISVLDQDQRRLRSRSITRGPSWLPPSVRPDTGGTV